MGNLQSTGSSSGHYRCDVKNNNLWFRTNDNTIPILIDEARICHFAEKEDMSTLISEIKQIYIYINLYIEIDIDI